MYNKISYLALAWILFVAHCSGINSEESNKIQKVYSEYRQALLDQDGSKALATVDSKTIDYYDKIVKHALLLPKSELDDLDLMSKFIVLRVRHEFKKTQLERFSGDSLFVYGVQNGWISRSTVSEINFLQNIRIDNNLANASSADAPNTPFLFFLKENEMWKIALWKSFELGNTFFQQSLDNSGLSEDEFIISLIEKLSEFKVDSLIFYGPS